MTTAPIALLPVHNDAAHEWCSVCGDDNIALVIQGGRDSSGTVCYYCGNTIALCYKHAAQMVREIDALKLCLD